MTPTVRDALAGDGPTFSFEFFPPKDDNDETKLWHTIRELEPLQPSFVSVTYGAGGTTREHTIEITEQIAETTTLLPVAHLTAVGHSVAELRQIAGRLVDAGVHDVLALRGDPPGDPEGEWEQHPEGLAYAADLVELMRAHADFCVGVAAFPNGHPRSESVDEDVRHFVEKCRAGAEYAITNMFFVADDYLRLRDRVAAAGCDVPILAGLMPVTNYGMIKRSEQLTGAPFPAELGERFAAVSDDPKAVRAMGIYETSKLADTLLAEGVPGIHFYTLNHSRATREVWANLALGTRA